MLNVAQIKKMFLKEGNNSGKACIYIEIVDRETDVEKMDLNTLLTEIFSMSKLKTVVIKGRMSDNPEIKPLITGLVAKGKYVTFITSAREDIGPIRPLPRVGIILTLVPPNKKKNVVRLANLPLLKEDDELKFLLKNMNDYRDAKLFLKSKTITRPTIIFGINSILEPQEFLDEYMEDCENFTFRTRVSKKLSL